MGPKKHWPCFVLFCFVLHLKQFYARSKLYIAHIYASKPIEAHICSTLTVYQLHVGVGAEESVMTGGEKEDQLTRPQRTGGENLAL